jgi:putative hemolysin
MQIVNLLLQILFILLLILFNGVFAMAEIAVVSARKARLQQRVNQGDERARVALFLANNPSRFLSTVQIGITLIGVLAGALGSATISREIAIWIGQIPILAPYSRTIAIALVVALITYLSLVLGELAPKRIAIEDAESIASNLAVPMHWLSNLAGPLVRLLSASTDFVVRTLGIRPSDEPPVTEEEIRVLIDIGTRAGVFEVGEQDLVEGVFQLADRRLESLMTPRSEIVWLDLEEDSEEIHAKLVNSRHTRFPVAHGGLDHVVGVVHAKDLLARNLEGKPLDLGNSMVDLLFVPENMSALNVLDRFKESHVQIAMVIDEFGGIQGLVTSFDILEGIAGDIPILGESTESQITRREDGTWLVDGALPIDEFKEVFEIKTLPGERMDRYQTLAGLVISILGRIPVAGDHFEAVGLRFEIVDMDDLRVDKVLVEPLETGEGSAEGRVG